MKYRGLLLPMILAAMCGDDAFVLNTKRGKGMQSTVCICIIHKTIII